MDAEAIARSDTGQSRCLSPSDPTRLLFHAHSKSETARQKAEKERISATAILKEQLLQRKAQQLEQQKEHKERMQGSASKAKASLAAARAQKEELAAQRRRDVAAVKQMGEELRRERSEQQKAWVARGSKVRELCAGTRAAAKTARARLCEDHLSEAKSWATERKAELDDASHKKVALTDARKATAKQLRDTESMVKQTLQSNVVAERHELAAAVRKRLEEDMGAGREVQKAERTAAAAPSTGGDPASQTQLADAPQTALRKKKRHELRTFSRVSRQTKDMESHSAWMTSSTLNFKPMERSRSLSPSSASALSLTQQMRGESQQHLAMARERRAQAIKRQELARDAVVKEQYGRPGLSHPKLAWRNANHYLEWRRGRGDPPEEIVEALSEGIEDEPPANPELEALKSFLIAKKASVLNMFRAMDKNRDGKLTKDEMINALPKLKFTGATEASLPEVVDLLFESLDEDGDGWVSYEEIHTQLRNAAFHRGSLYSRSVKA